MDLKARSRWVDYSRAKDAMFMYTDIEEAPWYVVNADIKRHARLNCISHLLSMIDYDKREPERITIPERRIERDFSPGVLKNLPYLVPARF